MRLLTNQPRAIEQAIREPRDEPLRLKDYSGAALPDAASWGFGLVYDNSGGHVKISDGSAWVGLQPLDADLTAIAALTTTGFGRSVLTLADAAAGRSLWGLGSAAVKSVGTSGDAVPVLNGAATTWAAGATFGGGVVADVFAFKDNGGLFNCLDSAGVLTINAGVFFPVWKLTTGAVMDLAAGTGAVKVNGTQIVAARRTGWAAATGTATRTTFATGSVTLPQLAERVKALIDDLIAHGLIGA